MNRGWREIAGATIILLCSNTAEAQVFCVNGGVDYRPQCTEQMKQICDPRFGGANDA